MVEKPILLHLHVPIYPSAKREEKLKLSSWTRKLYLVKVFFTDSATTLSSFICCAKKEARNDMHQNLGNCRVVDHLLFSYYVMCSRVIFSSSDKWLAAPQLRQLLGHLQVGLVLSNQYHNYPSFPVKSSVHYILVMSNYQ